MPLKGLLRHLAAPLFLLVFAFPQPGFAGQPSAACVLAKLDQSSLPPQASEVLSESNPRVRAAIAVQNRHEEDILSVPGVVGFAVGLTDKGNPGIVVFLKSKVPPGRIPDAVEGVPVVTRFIGEVFSKAGDTEGFVEAITSWLPRPVPIGVSTGSEVECSSGTIGARVTSGGTVYALSNNHVYAAENTAPKGCNTLQPGLYDSQCAYDPNNVIGTLSSFVPIKFGFTRKKSSANKVDAAISQSSTMLLGNATPAGGYGTPSSTAVPASLGQAVQKYGRTSLLTKGTVTGINTTVSVSYGSYGVAVFRNQITVASATSFIKPGDSGSLLVTGNSSANPVGLLFAGNLSGTYAFANPIAAVLGSFGVAIDGK